MTQTLESWLDTQHAALALTSTITTPDSPILRLLESVNDETGADIVAECAYAPGDVVFSEGDAGDAAFVIRAGRVAILKGDLRRPVLVGCQGVGELIGEMALLENRPRSASVIALEALRVLRIGRPGFQYLLDTYPAVAAQVMATLSARLRRSTDARSDSVLAESELAEELQIAGRVQSFFLPDSVPRLPGWDLAVGLAPARQTSGDFYDFIPLENGGLGVVIADVSDKGTGAALYMALSRTLIRTYAMAYPSDPARAIQAANARLLSDIQSDQFVTLFYGVINPAADTLTYVNAGHNPVYWLRPGTAPERLERTGLPLGLFEDLAWEQRTIALAPGDALILYTDGISESLNQACELFGEARLLAAALPHVGRPAQVVYDAVITAVNVFSGDEPQYDDITLLVAARR